MKPAFALEALDNAIGQIDLPIIVPELPAKKVLEKPVSQKARQKQK